MDACCRCPPQLERALGLIAYAAANHVVASRVGRTSPAPTRPSGCMRAAASHAACSHRCAGRYNRSRVSNRRPLPRRGATFQDGLCALHCSLDHRVSHAPRRGGRGTFGIRGDDIWYSLKPWEHGVNRPSGAAAPCRRRRLRPFARGSGVDCRRCRRRLSARAGGDISPMLRPAWHRSARAGPDWGRLS